MKPGRFWAATFLMVSPLLFASCISGKRSIKEWKKDTVNLNSAATDYFTAMRWKNYSKVGNYIEDEEERIEFIRNLEEWGREESIDEVRIDSVRLYKDRERGRVLATYTAIDPSTLVVRRVTERQVWYKKSRRWYIDLSSIRKK